MADHSPSKMLKFRNLLWKLHYKLEKQADYTSFEKLTEDPRYRANILAILMQSDDPKLSELAAKIIEQEIALGIHYEIDVNDISPLPKIKMTDTIVPEQGERNNTWFKPVNLILLFALIIVIAYFNFSQSLSHSVIVASSNTTLASPVLHQEKMESKLIAPTESIATPIDEKAVEIEREPVKLSSERIPATPKNTISATKSIATLLDKKMLEIDRKPVKQLLPEQILPTEKNTILRLHGSNTVGEQLAPALIEAYLKSLQAKSIKTIVTGDVDKSIQAFLPKQGWVYIEIHAHGSTTAFVDIDNGSADMGMASRKIKDKEVALLADRFGDLTRPISEHILGLDGLAVIVNKANPINSLNTQQIAGLFSGEIRNWSEVGGDDIPVSIYSRDNNSGTWDTFKHLVLKKYHKKLSPSSSRYESSSKLSDLVSQDTGAIGFIGLPYVRHAKLLAVADAIGAQSIIPTLFTVGTEDYPLSRRLYFYTPEKQSPFMRDFVEFTQSTTGQNIVKENGFISQNLYTVKPTIPEDAPAEYQKLTRNTKRLSLNFRFHSGSDSLDNKSLRDINRLTEYIAKNPGYQLSLFGFSDSIGDEGFNIQLSKKRAEKIETELQRRGVFPTIIKGFGEKMPVASNETKAGRDKNRRVEVWING